MKGVGKSLKKLLSLLLVTVLCLGAFSTNVYALTSSLMSKGKEDLQQAYEDVIEYAKKQGVPIDLTYETFEKEYYDSNASDIDSYVESYKHIIEPESALNSSGSSKWYYNTGTSLPQRANYSKYKLLSVVKKGDLVFEAKGGFGITAHIGIVEGIYYSSTYNQYYVRIIEAISDGVVRSVLDDERVDDKGVTILRVSGATTNIINEALKFCQGQLGKAYNLDFKKNTSYYEKDWYCSELVWAAYYNQGIDIEKTGINEPGVTPRDIRDSSKTYSISIK